jgi:hypothetical protein
MSYAIPSELQGTPDWLANRGRRLWLAMLLAAIFVYSGLNLLRLPVAGDVAPLFELVIRLLESAADPVRQTEGPAATRAAEALLPIEIQAETDTPAVPVESDPPAASIPAQSVEMSVDQPREIVPVPLEAVGTDRDPFPAIEIQVVENWRDFGAAVVREFIANLPKVFTVNPVFDEKRRLAAIKFRPSNAPLKREAWDNVEQDQIGRSILSLGDHCFQVLEDPSAVNREIFETYTQYAVYCTLSFSKKKGVELPWVSEIRAKYPYLREREAQKRDPNAF